MKEKIFEYIKAEINEKQFQSAIVNQDVLLNDMILDLLYDQGKINMYNDFYYYNEGSNAKCLGFSTFNNKIILYNTVFASSLEIKKEKLLNAKNQLEVFFEQVKDSLYRKINEAADYYDSILHLKV